MIPADADVLHTLIEADHRPWDQVDRHKPADTELSMIVQAQRNAPPPLLIAHVLSPPAATLVNDGACAMGATTTTKPRVIQAGHCADCRTCS